MAQFLNLLAISSLAILACSFGATPVTALTTDHHRIRDVLFPAHGHGAVTKKKRGSAHNDKRCKPRPKSSAQPKTVSTPKTVTTPKDSSSSKDKSKDNTPKPSSSSSSATAVSTTYTPPASSGSGKVGIAWSIGDDKSLDSYKTDKVKYIYSWSPWKPGYSDGLEFIPMLWGRDQIGDFTKLVKKGYAKRVFGFNEPNEKGQSWLSVSDGIQLWKEYLQPLKYQGYELISPATSSDPDGMTWVKNFVDQCGGGCTFDGVAVHWYDVKVADFITYLNNWHNAFGKPIYPTEFACQNYNKGPQCSESEVWNFMETAVHFMENTDWIPMYFAFGILQDMKGVNALDQLMNPQSKQPTALGKYYINGQ